MLNMDKIDKKDKKILNVLNLNGRAFVSEIARKTGIARDSVHYRLQRLLKNKVIRFVHTVLDPVELGYPVYTYVAFTLNNFDNSKEEKFYRFLMGHRNVAYVAKTTGKWDCLIAISAKNLEHFDSIMREIRHEFSEIIKEFESASIIQEKKYDSMVELIE